MIDDIASAKLGRIVHLVAEIHAAIETLPLGEWAIERRKEYAELKQLAESLRTHADKDVAALSFRLRAYLVELAESDRLVREDRPARSIRRQADLHRKTMERFNALLLKLVHRKEAEQIGV
ncbi:hypothetical protein ACFPYJ_17675 [Paenibacillus solisilvae]|uniref:Flagellar protein FliT n=1 Tax=Paenibacillus solisilvae TaxID=2486751 RepID=A0ABW0W1E4_9BACL